ncbi:branched-chain amino acid ABC transporter permease [Agrococcus baldri]|uniref:Branched-chain amino acid ABC transporter permease n=1 Tax=Agrococcus baldri TaxID=153730 RepID=A0AA87UT40_9MICO|nr:branched-chain amino acid ABC transporter permease [Agrococcus baldri]GEK81646.1 branched-chain amino acid ABC transporter permease [Agrococcus baldri]
MRSFLSSRWGKLAIGVVLVGFAAMLPLLNIHIPGVLPGPTYTPGALSVLAYAMLIAALALSYHLIFGVAGMLSFGHAMFFAAGAYGLGILLNLLAPSGMPPEAVFLVAIVLTLVVALVLGNLVGALALRVTGISFAMVTLAFAQAANVMIRRNTGDLTGGEEGVRLEASLVPEALVGVVNTRNLYWLALGILVLVYLACVWIERSRLGHVVAAARENELRVTVLGLRPYTVRLFVFGAAAVLAAVAGIGFMLLQSSATPRISTADFTLTLLVIVVLGGVGYRWGAIVGGIVYTILDQRLAELASSSWIAELPPVLHIPLSEPLFILGMLFVLVVMFAPGGIVGISHRLTKGRGGKKDAAEPAVLQDLEA